MSGKYYQEEYETMPRDKTSMAKVKRNLSYATIKSPIDGVVISKAVEEGQTVAAGFSTPTLFTIANDLTKMQVIANIDEADIGQVKDGHAFNRGNDLFFGHFKNSSWEMMRRAYAAR